MSALVGYMLLRGLFGVFDSMLCAITFFAGTKPESSNGQERLCCPLRWPKKTQILLHLARL